MECAYMIIRSKYISSYVMWQGLRKQPFDQLIIIVD